MAKWMKIGLVILGLLLALAVKLIWFQPPFTQERALDTARWQLEEASQERGFDLGKFGNPTHVSGNGKDGYIVAWDFSSPYGNTKLSVIVSVSIWDVDFTGSPFVLDCRTGRDNETRQSGFGYLCK